MTTPKRLLLLLSLLLFASVICAAQKPELVVQTGHTDLINSVAFSPDGRTLASGSGDETIKLWEVETGNELRTLRGHTHHVYAVAFSPDGKTLASGSADKTIKVWDVETGNELRTLRGHTDWVTSIVFSSNGKKLASGSDKETKVWDVATGEQLQTFAGKGRVAFSPDDRMVASAGENFTIKLWSVETGAEIHTLAAHAAWVRSIAFSPDGKMLASGSADKTIKVWDVETGNEVRTLRGHTHWVTSVKFSPDGRTLASGSADDTIKLWDVGTGNDLRILRGHVNSVNSIAFSPDGKTLASGSGDVGGADDDVIKLWDVETAKELRTLRPHGHKNNSLAVFSPDSKTLAIPTANKAIKLWDVATGQELKSLDGHTKNVFVVVFSADSKMLASGSFDNTIKLWDIETGKELKTLTGHADFVLYMTFSSDGKRLASSSGDKITKLWDVETGKELKSFSRDDEATRIEVLKAVPHHYDDNRREPDTSPDRRWQAKEAENGKINLIESATGQVKASLVAIDETDWAVVTPDGLFDGSPAAWKFLSWRLEGNTFRNAPIEAFFNEFYRPGLLADIFAGKTIEQPTRDLATIDIRQPEVKVTLSNNNQNAANITTRQITVNVEIKDAPADKRRPTTSGARDVRLFRNGSLVKLWRGDVLNGKQSVTLLAAVPVVAGDNTFMAYAFNNDNVKSRDGELIVKGADALKRKGTAYILAIGVNEYANSQYNLRYAVADAQGVSEELKRRQEQLGIYERVEVTVLINENATKEKIGTALTAMQGRTQPEDAVIVYFAGHGTAQGNHFYLIPHDLGYAGARDKVDAAGLEQIIKHSISDEQLEAAFEKIDAGHLLMVIDACNSGQALEAEEKRRGPMNSKGLAQLAYEKGMYILTAAQSFQAAQEAAQIGHGLLSYALIEEGLKQAVADKEPKDGQIVVREWLDYATKRVPRMQVEKMKAARGLGLNLSFKEEERTLDIERRSGQQPRVFYRRELEAQPLVVAKITVAQSIQ